MYWNKKPNSWHQEDKIMAFRALVRKSFLHNLNRTWINSCNNSSVIKYRCLTSTTAPQLSKKEWVFSNHLSTAVASIICSVSCMLRTYLSFAVLEPVNRANIQLVFTLKKNYQAFYGAFLCKWVCNWIRYTLVILLPGSK